MENASEALLMAGQVLIFIIALTICISSFTTVRVGIDRMMNEQETIKLVKDSDQYINFIQSRNNGATRIVGAETVISSMYRAIKEDYVLYIEFKTDSDILGGLESDLETPIEYRGRPIKITFERHGENNNLLKITIDDDAIYRSHAILANGFYKRIKDERFEEFIGEYQENLNSAVSSENKPVRRIITYKQQ